GGGAANGSDRVGPFAHRRPSHRTAPESRQQIQNILIAVVGSFRQQGQHSLFQRRRQRRLKAAQGGGGAADDVADDLLVAASGEGRLAGEHVIQHSAEAVEVAAHRRRLAEARTLGGHVGDIAQYVLHVGSVRLAVHDGADTPQVAQSPLVPRV